MGKKGSKVRSVRKRHVGQGSSNTLPKSTVEGVGAAPTNFDFSVETPISSQFGGEASLSFSFEGLSLISLPTGSDAFTFVKDAKTSLEADHGKGT